MTKPQTLLGQHKDCFYSRQLQPGEHLIIQRQKITARQQFLRKMGACSNCIVPRYYFLLPKVREVYKLLLAAVTMGDLQPQYTCPSCQKPYTNLLTLAKLPCQYSTDISVAKGNRKNESRILLIWKTDKRIRSPRISTRLETGQVGMEMNTFLIILDLRIHLQFIE